MLNVLLDRAGTNLGHTCGRLARAFLLSVAIATPAIAQTVPSKDLSGAKDSPIVSRFAGSVIIGYSHVDYDQMVLPMGKLVPSNHLSKSATVEGQITRIAYAAPAGKSALEIFRSFQDALTQAGFQTRYACSGDEGDSSCGDGYGMAQAIVGQDAITQLAHNTNDSTDANLMIDMLWPTNDKLMLETAHLDRPTGAVDIVLFVSAGDNHPPGVYLGIAEAKPMASGEVTVDAKAMSQALSQAGHIALYGIHFATDSAVLAPDSDNTLDQMLTLLAAQPALKVYIVGHTDDTGALAHNLSLSQQRAEAVVAALVKLGISRDRMAAKGLASYAPVASNDTDAGKALNRRVELVQQ